MRVSLLISVPFVLGIGLGLSGCGDESTGTGSNTCFDYAAFNGMTPAVSFKTDVLPTFQQSCGLSNSCHGDQAGPADRPYLGPAMGIMASAADITAIFNANVNADAVHASMKIVAPGKPEASFLMYKLDGSFSCSGVTCAAAGCGTSMPQGSGALSESSRDAIRRWIAQGAQNN